ncbi:hypothetical protein [Herbaspirillum frisingense]|uniref:hypothetical protein n=1 Tax=Herbaspirillum frisingense TaxID=92645 RepID=UPI001F276622|nr:hypothetical protein [Herbaspirillum frisingense]UIN20597.1 hypothetical protein LAZ82_19265 [Herbaspirillum frisingense]
MLTRLLAGRGVSAGMVLLAAGVLSLVWYFTIIRIENEKQLAIAGSIADSRNVAAIVSANLDEVLGKTLLYSRIGQSMLNGEQSSSAYFNPLFNGDSATCAWPCSMRVVGWSIRRRARRASRS